MAALLQRVTCAARPPYSVSGSLTEETSSMRWGGSLAFRLPKTFPSIAVPAGRLHQRASPICMVLPTGNRERKVSLKWEARAVKSYSMAELEARKLKYPTTGSESLLMGILTEDCHCHAMAKLMFDSPPTFTGEPSRAELGVFVGVGPGTSAIAKWLRKNGITLFAVRDETVDLLGKADMYFFSPEHPPLTQPAQNAIDWAMDEAIRLGIEGEISTTMLLLGIWEQKGSAGQLVLEKLGFDETKAAELISTLTKKEPVTAASS